MYIPRRYARFPEYEGSAPEIPEGVVLRRLEEDFGPATKLLGPLRDNPEPETQILFCDDDMRYEAGWAASLFTEQARRPDCAICPLGSPLSAEVKTDYVSAHDPQAERWAKTLRYHLLRLGQKFTTLSFKPSRPLLRRNGFGDLIYGAVGTVVRSAFFDDRVFEIPVHLRSVDDIWISGMLAVRGVPVWAPAGHMWPHHRGAARIQPLLKSVIADMDRCQANEACVRYFQETYGIWIAQDGFKGKSG